MDTQMHEYRFLRPISNESPSLHSDASTSPENCPKKEPPATVFPSGEAAEDALLHPWTLHHYATLLARPRYLRLDSPENCGPFKRNAICRQIIEEKRGIWDLDHGDERVHLGLQENKVEVT
ncbi:hypothetical protein L6164_017948 [Bauhinia variegata]|uniref:Uncharacterized protein n=1 Tax=Bauhinia variegata TaxID=167791 RepID=A0ACB9N9N5_BAUVA|nr:hypothetical protein L6164_017948 [Bauhinia variegata]